MLPDRSSDNARAKAVVSQVSTHGKNASWTLGEHCRQAQETISPAGRLQALPCRGGLGSFACCWRHAWSRDWWRRGTGTFLWGDSLHYRLASMALEKGDFDLGFAEFGLNVFP